MANLETKSSILERYKLGKLAHAILLCGGEAGEVKLELAREIAQEILQTRNDVNPDMLVVEKDAGKKEITVEKARAIADFVNQTSANSGKKIIIINAACELNRSAANAILKNLEEPSADSFFILIAHNFSKVLPTIRSRCQIVKIPPISRADFAKKMHEINPQITSSELEILAEICGNSARQFSEFGLETSGLYHSLLDSFSAGKIDDELLKKISDRNFNFVLFEIIFELFCNRLLKFLQNFAADFLPTEQKVFANFSTKFSTREIFAKVDESLISLHKTVPMSLNKSLSFINIFNQFK